MLEISSIFILRLYIHVLFVSSVNASGRSEQTRNIMFVFQNQVSHNTPIACSSLNELWKNLYVFANNIIVH